MLNISKLKSVTINIVEFLLSLVLFLIINTDNQIIKNRTAEHRLF